MVENNFALIVGEDFDFTEINASIYSVGDAKIGSGLNNDADIIIDNNDFNSPKIIKG